jgi:putative component of membrane protein insertase Oxa1/YidC/SpoIIIJ protein YidD
VKFYLFLFFLSASYDIVLAQTMEKIILERKFSSQNHTDSILIKTAFFSPFRWYKQFVSNQDVPNACGFLPSCSEYSRQAFKKGGIFKGILATFDRLSRCNGKQSPLFYVYDPEKNKFLDDYATESLP